MSPGWRRSWCGRAGTFNGLPQQPTGTATDKEITVVIAADTAPGTYEVVVSEPAGTGTLGASTNVVVP